MEFIGDVGGFPASLPGSAVAFGFFDGVHRGHRAVVARTREVAAGLGVPSAVLLLDRHPASVVRPESAPRLLTDLSQKLDLLGATGVDVVCLLRFDGERSLQPPEEFVREVLVGALRARAVVAGRDFHFGHRRHGDLALLARMGDEGGFRVVAVPYAEAPGGGAISATAVRGALIGGDVARAAELLGRPHEVHGIVEHGDSRGRALGFPTANVAVAGDILLPADGVYAGTYRRPTGERHPAAISIGRRPTFYRENGLLLVEAHLIDVEGVDLYGERAWVEVRHRLRGQVGFDTVDALVTQMGEDVSRARGLLR